MVARYRPALIALAAWGALSLLESGCAGDPPSDEPTAPTDVVGSDAASAQGGDAQASSAGADAKAAPPDASATPGDAASHDASGADAVSGADTGALGAEPLARIYAHNPLDPDLTQVVLPHLTDPDGYLVGEFADVLNCVQEVGQTVQVRGVDVGVCTFERLAQRGTDGTYLHVQPADDRDGNDAFAEVMMYWHVNRIHDYFHDVHGLTSLDWPLQALVNVQIHVDQFGGWLPFDNAAFVPKESLDQLPFPLGIDGDALIFGQGSLVDFSYEAAVIYHEYTHAMVGTTRLVGFVADEYGIDPSPGAMNEGFADYFAATVLDNPLIGAYALKSVPAGFGSGPPQDLSRDLSVPHRCPDDLVAEVHADGRIVGSALWALREAIGAEAADHIVLGALETFDDHTGLADAAEAIVAHAAAFDPALEDTAREVLHAHGLIDCTRVVSADAYEAQQAQAGRYVLFAGTQETGLAEFGDGVPSFVQWKLPPVPAGSAVGVYLEVTPGGMMGLGAFLGNVPPPDLTFLFKRGGEPIRYAYDGAKPSDDAEFSVHVEPASSTGDTLGYELVLGGACVATGQPLTFQFVNGADLGGAVVWFETAVVDPSSVDVTASWDHCDSRTPAP